MSESAQAATIASAQAEAHGNADVHKAAPVAATEGLQAQKEADANESVQAPKAASQAGGQGPAAKGALPAGKRQSLVAKGAVPASERQTQAATDAAVKAADHGTLAKQAGAGADMQVSALGHTACKASRQPDKESAAAADRHSTAAEGPTTAADRHSTLAQGVGPVSEESPTPAEAAPIDTERSSDIAKGIAPAGAQGSSIQAQAAAPEAERQKPLAAEASSQADRPTAADARTLAGSAKRRLAGAALRARGQSLGAEGTASQAEWTGSEAKATANGAATAAAAGKKASRAIQASSEGTQPVPEQQTDTQSRVPKTQGTSATKEGSIMPAQFQPSGQDTTSEGPHAALAAAQPAAAAADPAADQHAAADSSQGVPPKMTPQSGTEAGGPSAPERVLLQPAGRGVLVDPWGHVPLVLHHAKGKVSVELFSQLTGKTPAACTWHGSTTLTAFHTVALGNLFSTVVPHNLTGYLHNGNPPSVLMLMDC